MMTDLSLRGLSAEPAGKAEEALTQHVLLRDDSDRARGFGLRGRPHEESDNSGGQDDEDGATNYAVTILLPHSTSKERTAASLRT
jgi:hypothetical protein